jgi:MoaA/NifB/PqqE/SkfB family radical SAM enzyme
LTFTNTYNRLRTYMRTHGLSATAEEVARRATRRARMGDLPASVHVEISNVCNLNCEYCVLDQNAEGDRVMSAETFSAVLPFLRGARRVDVSGIAEPLMNTRWPDILRDIREAAPHARIAMCSNMTLLTREKAEILVDSTLDELTFSLDGVDPALVDEVRRGGSLIGDARQYPHASGRQGGARVRASRADCHRRLQRSNVEQLPDIVRLAAELGVQAVNVNGLGAVHAGSRRAARVDRPGAH